MELSEDYEDYLDDWSKMMIEIFGEKVERLRVVDTGAFYRSFSERINDTVEGRDVVVKFVDYGMYQALGVGKGYKRGNGGDLEFLDPEYRRQHRLGPPRKRRDWFSKKWFMSVMNAVEDLARITGEESVRVFCDSIDDIRETLRK